MPGERPQREGGGGGGKRIIQNARIGRKEEQARRWETSKKTGVTYRRSFTTKCKRCSPTTPFSPCPSSSNGRLILHARYTFLVLCSHRDPAVEKTPLRPKNFTFAAAPPHPPPPPPSPPPPRVLRRCWRVVLTSTELFRLLSRRGRKRYLMPPINRHIPALGTSKSGRRLPEKMLSVV